MNQRANLSCYICSENKYKIIKKDRDENNKLFPKNKFSKKIGTLGSLSIYSLRYLYFHL